MQVTVIGSLNCDLVTYTKQVPRGGETVAATLFETHLGGKGFNAAIAVGKLAAPGAKRARLVGKVGDDQYGRDLRSALLEAGVDADRVETVRENTGVAVIIVDEQCGDNRILIADGANSRTHPSAQEMQELFPSDEKQYVLFQNEVKCTEECINWLSRERPHIVVCYNPSPIDRNLLSRDVFAKVGLLIVNEGEAMDCAAQILPRHEYCELQRTIDDAGPEGDPYRRLVQLLSEMLCKHSERQAIITMGASGSVFSEGGGPAAYVPAPAVSKVVDTTGAGDTFFGATVLQLAAGKDLATAIEFATRAAGLAIQVKGAASSIPRFESV